MDTRRETWWQASPGQERAAETVKQRIRKPRRPRLAAVGPTPPASEPLAGPGGVIGEATERSATFRGLIDTIEASDGIVHVSEGKCRHGARACLPLTVTVAGPFRILFIFVRIDTRRADWDYMGSIGHELYHAIEVLSDPRITSSHAMVRLFTNEGRLVNGTFETNAAVDTGSAVRLEVLEVASSGVQVMRAITRLVRGREALGAATPSRASNRA